MGWRSLPSKDFSGRAQINLWPRQGERTRDWKVGLVLGIGQWFPNLFAQRASRPTSAHTLCNPTHYVIAVSCVLGFGRFKSPLGDAIVQSSSRSLLWAPSEKALFFPPSLHLSHPKPGVISVGPHRLLGTGSPVQHNQFNSTLSEKRDCRALENCLVAFKTSLPPIP